MESRLKIQEAYELPTILCEDVIYRLLTKDRGTTYYRERTDRNIGWITEDEQQVLRDSVVGIAGCGGMGGLVAATLARLGVGEIRIADCEVFDVSNLNRQFGATRTGVGISKTFETARMIRSITDDLTLVLYPQGITEETVDNFLDGCDIVCDEIEFWAVGARILLHEHAECADIPLLNCSTVGFGTRLFLFDHGGTRMQDMLGFSREHAYVLQERIADGTASQEEVAQVMRSVLDALIPELPEYRRKDNFPSSADHCLRRLQDECKAPIIATNPPLAAGFLANHVLLRLLQAHGSFRSAVRPPPTPGYLYFDTVHMSARSVQRKEILHDSHRQRS